jgi:hypothetical protein
VKRTSWLLLPAAVLISACGSDQPAATALQGPASTVAVERGALSSMVSLNGLLSYRARADGSPYIAVNQAHGTYTRLPAVGDKVDCGDVLYRVDDRPVLLVCGTVPAYRDLRRGDRGKDVRQLNRTLRGVGDRRFTAKTKAALERLQRATGAKATGALALGAAVVVPEPARISKVAGTLGGPARPGAAVAEATSDALEVQVQLEPTQREDVRPGDRARITLPDNTVAKGTVHRVGTFARKDDKAGSATIPASIRLEDAKQARGLDQAPVQVEVTTTGVENALSVPVTALVGRSGGGFAVEVARDGGRRELVAVRLGLFDTGAGRVQVEGDLGAGDQVVVPSL